MKNNEKLTHREIMDGLTTSWRELFGTEVSHRNMPNIINRGRTAAQLVTAMHREQMFEEKKQKAKGLINQTQISAIKDLKKLT